MFRVNPGIRQRNVNQGVRNILDRAQQRRKEKGWQSSSSSSSAVSTSESSGSSAPSTRRLRMIKPDNKYVKNANVMGQRDYRVDPNLFMKNQNMDYSMKRIRSQYLESNDLGGHRRLLNLIEYDMEKALVRKNELEQNYEDLLKLNSGNTRYTSMRLTMFPTRREYDELVAIVGARLKAIDNYISRLRYIEDKVKETMRDLRGNVSRGQSGMYSYATGGKKTKKGTKTRKTGRK